MAAQWDCFGHLLIRAGVANVQLHRQEVAVVERCPRHEREPDRLQMRVVEPSRAALHAGQRARSNERRSAGRPKSQRSVAALVVVAQRDQLDSPDLQSIS